MSQYSSWISAFRSWGAKLGAPRGEPQEAPVYDAARIDRVLNRGKAQTTFPDLGVIKSLSPADRMIAWLKEQPPEIVHAAAEVLNWDQAREVIQWLISQPTTDAATAVKLFMRAEPAYYVMKKGEDPSYEDSVEALMMTFASNWLAGRYARGGVGYDPSEVSPYGSSDLFFINDLNNQTAQHAAHGAHPLPSLPGLAGPFEGPRPQELDVYLKRRGQSEYFLARLLFAGLGTWFLDDEIDEAAFDAWIRRSGLDED